MYELLFLKEETVKKIKALKKDKYTMKDVDALCELLGLELFSYQKVVLLHHLNDKNYMRYICR